MRHPACPDTVNDTAAATARMGTPPVSSESQIKRPELSIQQTS
ncbi:MAG: hypothetical protein U0165_17610 [Polyangiaceae bacterium]